MTDDGMTVTTSHAGDTESSLQGVLESVLRLQAEWSRDITPPMRERGRQVRELGPAAIKRLITGDGYAAVPDLAVRGGDGAGSRAKVPWIRVYSESRSPAPTVGWYATYLFAADGSVAYLSLNQGTTLPGFRAVHHMRSGNAWRVHAGSWLPRWKGHLAWLPRSTCRTPAAWGQAMSSGTSSHSRILRARCLMIRRWRRTCWKPRPATRLHASFYLPDDLP